MACGPQAGLLALAVVSIELKIKAELGLPLAECESSMHEPLGSIPGTVQSRARQHVPAIHLSTQEVEAGCSRSSSAVYPNGV